jgi:hypothetical protein
MKILATQMGDEQSGIDLGVVASASMPDGPKKKPGIIIIPKKPAQPVTCAPEADLITDLVYKIENLKEEAAKARVFELEEANEKTYFEIGAVLSVMQREHWFDPFGSLDEWVESKTVMKRSKARALIQIYNAIVDAGITWARIKHIEWTKLRAIARVLTKDNADHWIEIASNQSKVGVIETVKAHLTPASTAHHGSSTSQFKTFKFHEDKAKAIEAAIDKAKKTSHTHDDTAALEYICLDYVDECTLPERFVGLPPAAVARAFADVLDCLDKYTAQVIVKAMLDDVTHKFDLIG